MTVTYTPTAGQIGYDTVGVWAAGGPIVSNAPSTGGIQYTIPAPDQLLFRSLVVTLTPTAAPTPTGTFTIGLVNNINEPVYSNTNLPSAQTTILLYSAACDFSSLAATPFSLQLGVEQLQGNQYVGGIKSAMQVLGHSSFQGHIALVLTFTGDVTFSTAAPLVGDETPFLTGLPTTKRRYSRADWCPRCGQPIFREQLIRDGYTKSLVCSDCWDRAEQRYPMPRYPKEINS